MFNLVERYFSQTKPIKGKSPTGVVSRTYGRISSQNKLTPSKNPRPNVRQCWASLSRLSFERRRKTSDYDSPRCQWSQHYLLPSFWKGIQLEYSRLSTFMRVLTTCLLMTEKNKTTRRFAFAKPLSRILLTRWLDVQIPWAILVSISSSLFDLKTKYFVCRHVRRRAALAL